jgi:hypothetical protein
MERIPHPRQPMDEIDLEKLLTAGRRKLEMDLDFHVSTYKCGEDPFINPNLEKELPELNDYSAAIAECVGLDFEHDPAERQNYYETAYRACHFAYMVAYDGFEISPLVDEPPIDAPVPFDHEMVLEYAQNYLQTRPTTKLLIDRYMNVIDSTGNRSLLVETAAAITFDSIEKTAQSYETMVKAETSGLDSWGDSFDGTI